MKISEEKRATRGCTNCYWSGSMGTGILDYSTGNLIPLVLKILGLMEDTGIG